MNRSKKEALKESLDKLDVREHAQIFEVIRRYTNNFTTTQTGVLVSSDNLPDECLEEIERMVSFFMDIRAHLNAKTD